MVFYMPVMGVYVKGTQILFKGLPALGAGMVNGQHPVVTFSGIQSHTGSGLIQAYPLLGWPINDWVMGDYEGLVISAPLGTSQQATAAAEIPVGSPEAAVRLAVHRTAPSAPRDFLPSLLWRLVPGRALEASYVLSCI